jgi:hypothetical protein
LLSRFLLFSKSLLGVGVKKVGQPGDDMNVTIVRLLLALLLTVASCLAKDKPLLREGFQKAGLRALIVVMNEDDPDSDRVKMQWMMQRHSRTIPATN